jgi:hypothetical protein
MARPQPKTVRELLYWSYACLAMAHSAVANGQEQYTRINYIVRARLYKGLMDGTMNIGSIFQDERIKLTSGVKCSYCGSSESITLDHVFPRFVGGVDSCDNLTYACRPCNSSKGKKDLLEWMNDKGQFPPLMTLRRYLKIAIIWSINNELMEFEIQAVKDLDIPFNIDLIPIRFPPPKRLCLTAESHEKNAAIGKKTMN